MQVSFLGHNSTHNKAEYSAQDAPSSRLREGVTDRRPDGPTDRRTDGPTDGWTDGRTDTPSYRDARMHLKIGAMVLLLSPVRIELGSCACAHIEALEEGIG